MYLRELNNSVVDLAVVFHDELNPRVFSHGQMIPIVRYKLLRIARELVKFIDVPNINLKDVTLSGSNAAYTYTKNSDLDLHLIVDVPHENEGYLRQLYNAKKNQYNFQHNIKIKGIDVEVYIQPSIDKHVSAGIYSILDDRWLSEPRAITVSIDDHDVTKKVENYLAKIEMALQSSNLDEVNAVKERLYSLRKVGLEREGEFSSENIAYKVLRNKGYIDKLWDHIYNLEDQSLSLENIDAS